MSVLAGIFLIWAFGALFTAYVCGRWHIEEGPTTANILIWPMALLVFAFMWAYSKGAGD